MKQALQRFLLKAQMNIYPPFWGAGIRVKSISKDMLRIHVEMPLTFLNRNYVGVHFGGSLYALTDGFYMLMLMHQLGNDYIVWDKSATIHFKKPGRTKVHAIFEITKQEIDTIRTQANTEKKVEPLFHVDIVDEQNNVIAQVEKTLYVRKKKHKRHKHTCIITIRSREEI